MLKQSSQPPLMPRTPSIGQIREVLVKWTGFDILSSTWEPIENIPDKFIDAFRKIASVEEEDGFETDEDDE